MMKRMRQLHKLLAAILCAAALTVSAAAQSGSLTVTVDGAEAGMTVTLYAVADPQGVPTADFAGAGLTDADLLDEKQNSVNSGILASYAQENALSGTALETDETGAVCFDGLAEGIWLVVGETADGLVFDPFLVYLPTVINGEALYDISANPKVEEPSQPDEPDQPDQPGPNLPQTGVKVWIVYALVGAGAVLVLCGAILLAKGKKKDE